MQLEWDENKRSDTLENRGLDFADAAKIFAGKTLQHTDDRQDYGEIRYVTIGRLGRKMIMLVWTPRDPARRIISMRECDEQERKRYARRLARSR
ncbi:BrnT family toxin [Caulobacter sp.]|uniref:BrnT family toxin n=1 Tax=Caulobacter sp. TaxID=78 RepID=UPI001B2CCE3C|nr:BrnT family toxin [Caulobacter sp.]MBO9543261.1 BrnT family toxin [Caulobacter sp.]